MAAPRTIYIAGAGIAGLTLALALAKFGLKVVVLERNDAVSPFGAGLQISPNARRVLDRLGLADAIAERSFAPSGIDIFPSGRIRPIQTLVLGAEIEARFGAPYAVMHRADLADLLHGAARRFANIDIVPGVSEFGLVAEGPRLTVTATEPDGKLRRAHPFAFVGADGVNSITRTKFLGGPVAAYTGKLAWRTLVDPDALKGLFDLDRTSLLLGTDHHLVVYPLPHRGKVNLALFTTAPQPLPLADTPQRPALKARPGTPIAHVLAAAGESWTAWALSSVETETWSQGAIGLVGDAAHAMLPFQAQGAAMGIEDAAVLAPLLAASPSAEHAFARYAALRQARVRRVQAVSRSNGRIFHMGAPLSLARDAVIRAGGPRDHFRRLAWLYGYDPHLGA
ncbi:FAD-dependent monooxygenase [Pelagibacterium lacus]|uniref:Monooxygenase n=1 Tax=Pelagibacterium lacus TaxID=2282655 RepID=A0A369W8E1_9HYPH|nr:FAD-dependent monooxygenase [Pelagibacterium lacus]RDE10317.1 monooxygenase [Pelagibacterium lacus]